jgi:AraC-like DNA-binding protein
VTDDEPLPGRDRLRELLDAVLDEDNRTLPDMAGDAFASPWYFARQVSRGAGEPPVALRRRVLMERAAWQLREGSSVTAAAFTAGYESVEGFARAFAAPPARRTTASPAAATSTGCPHPTASTSTRRPRCGSPTRAGAAPRTR